MKACEFDDRAEHAALHLHHLDRRQMIAVVGRAAAILEQQAFEAAIVALAHRRVHADVGGDAGQHDVLDAARAQDQFEVGRAERALAGLVDDDLAGDRREFVDDLPAGLAAHQDLAAGAGIADAGADAARAPAFVCGQVGQVRPMPLARVDDVIALGARRREQRLDRLDRRAREREIVAHLVDIAAAPAEIGLHVDDDDGGVLRPQIAVVGPGIGVGFDGRHGSPHLAMLSSPGMSAAECLALDVAIMMASVRM